MAEYSASMSPRKSWPGCSLASGAEDRDAADAKSSTDPCSGLAVDDTTPATRRAPGSAALDDHPAARRRRSSATKASSPRISGAWAGFVRGSPRAATSACARPARASTPDTSLIAAAVAI